jgi:pyruvate ferredoxin oxidoreductase gamma subunit
LHQLDVFGGLSQFGFLLLNSTRSFEELGLGDFVRRYLEGHACTVAASDIALAHIGRPLPNAALLGAFSALTGRLALRSVETAIAHKFSGKVASANIAAARAAYQTVNTTLAREAAHA